MSVISLLNFSNVGLYGLILCAIALFWFYCQSTYNYWRKLNIKYVKPVLFFGNFAKFALQCETYYEVCEKLYKALGDEPFGGVYELRDPVLMVKDPELICTILVKDFEYFCNRDRSLLIKKNKELNPLSVHLTVAEGAQWKELRQKTSPVFTSSKLEQMHKFMIDCGSLLNKYIDRQIGANNSTDLEVKSFCNKLSVDGIVSLIFGIEEKVLGTNEKFYQIFNEILTSTKLGRAIRLIVSGFNNRLSNILKLRDVKKEVIDFFLNLTLNTIEYRRKKGVTSNDALQLFMDLQNSHINPRFAVGSAEKKLFQIEKFSEIDVAANSFLFFIAGSETAASTLSFCLYEIALNQNIQTKLRSEVQKVKEKYNILNYKSIKELTFMDAVLSETFRKYPPAALLSRLCTKSYKLPNSEATIPKGTKILIPLWSIHHDWRYYPNPEVFDPERFLGENKFSRPNGVLLTFGMGPRYCLGKRFVILELKSVLSSLILAYEFKPSSKTQIPLKFNGGHVLLNINEIWLNITKIKSDSY